MRTRPNQARANSRFAFRYEKLYEPLIDLIQSLEDMLPPGFQLGDEVDITLEDGKYTVTGNGRPPRLILHDAKQMYTLEVRKNPSSIKRTAVD